MKFLKKLACAAAVAMTFAGSASAATVLNNWVFNPTGGGFASGQTVKESLDVNGNAFIQITPTGGTSFSFTEHAVFNIVQADANGALFPVNYPGGNITATFVGAGSGNFSGAFSFSGGTIRMYQNEVNNQYASTNGFYGANLGEEIATFTVMAGGGGLVDASGSPTNNGQVTVFAKADAGSLDAGYFFRENGDDLSLESVMAFAFTNANTVGRPDAVQVSEIACEFAGFTGAGCNGTAYANGPGNIFLGNNGQFKLAEVPEPGSLALFGIAMLGAGVMSRKRAKKA
ncbi:flocculation-associated PEP-CTERM protein PepA [Massilia sp. CMS3.1]|uniref:flocculation-associated PEP-CTERM protein PepA n=1 Tax=Massilia sp. CMS3.1 TaxID=3373083 RepID=UPI003EE6DFBA